MPEQEDGPSALFKAFDQAWFPEKGEGGASDDPPDETRRYVWIEYIDVEDADMRLFGNKLAFNGIGVYLREPLVFVNYDGAAHLSAIQPMGIVISVDCAGEMSPEYGGAGFHNHLIPWSSITHLHQYIAT